MIVPLSTMTKNEEKKQQSEEGKSQEVRPYHNDEKDEFRKHGALPGKERNEKAASSLIESLSDVRSPAARVFGSGNEEWQRRARNDPLFLELPEQLHYFFIG